MKKSKIISVVLSAIMLTSTAASAEFNDMPNDSETRVAIENAVSNGILSGFAEDNTVRPDERITRAQMASIITRAMGATTKGDISKFTDVASDAWYYSAMASAYDMGAFSGDDQNLMHPENNITFQECFTVLSRVFDLLPTYKKSSKKPESLSASQVYSEADKRIYDVSALDGYADGSSVAQWAKAYYSGIVSNGGWSGQNGYLTPTEYITRGQFAIVMNNIVQNYVDTPGTYTTLPEGTNVIRSKGVVVSGVSGKVDILISDALDVADFSVSNVNINRLVVRGCITSADNTSYILPTGKISKIRLLKPAIGIDLSKIEFDNIYGPPGCFYSGITAK